MLVLKGTNEFLALSTSSMYQKKNNLLVMYEKALKSFFCSKRIKTNSYFLVTLPRDSAIDGHAHRINGIDLTISRSS